MLYELFTFMYSSYNGPNPLGVLLSHWKIIIQLLLAAGLYRTYHKKRLSAKIRLLYHAPDYRLTIDGKTLKYYGL